jgi:hypothetical protein
MKSLLNKPNSEPRPSKYCCILWKLYKKKGGLETHPVNFYRVETARSLQRRQRMVPFQWA